MKKSAPNREKNRHQKSTIFSPLVFHRLRLLDQNPDTSLVFFVRFPFFSKDFRGSAKRTTLAFFGVSLPKGPFRTKNTTDSKFITGSQFTTAIVKHYGGHFETTIFKETFSSKSLQIVKTTAVAKHYGIECRSVFSTEGSFGLFFFSEKARVGGSGKMTSGEVFLLTVGVFLLTVKLLGLQSLKALIRCTFPL